MYRLLVLEDFGLVSLVGGWLMSDIVFYCYNVVACLFVLMPYMGKIYL